MVEESQLSAHNRSSLAAAQDNTKNKTLAHYKKGDRKAAFTLAEVLIALLIIGVVAAMTLPTLFQNIANKKNETKVAVFNSKFIAGLNSAKAEGDMGNQFKDTYDFLKNGLSKHLKMSMICKNNELEKCMGYEYITYENDAGAEKTAKVNSLKTAKKLNLNNPDYSNTAAFIMADGTPVLLTYNTKCMSDGGADKSISLCVAGLFDISGSSKPNMFINKVVNGKSEARDIRSFNGAAPAGSCVGIINDICISSGAVGGSESALDDVYASILAVDPSYVRPTYIINDRSIENNNWQMGKDYCEKVGGGAHLPSLEDLAAIASAMYGEKIPSKLWSVTDGLDWSANKNAVLSSLGINDTTNDEYRLWSSSSGGNGTYAHFQDFFSNSTFSDASNNYYTMERIICIE